MTQATSDLMTAAELERLHLPNKSTELVRGRLIVREPPGTYHGLVSARLTHALGSFVFPRHLGFVFGQDTGFKIESNPDTVRAPDAAFATKERASSIQQRGYAVFAPELVAEVVSPDDRPGELLAKVAQWIDAGARLVWVIDPMRGVAHVYSADGSLRIVPETGVLNGEDVLPGFTCPLAEILSLDP